MSDNQNVFDRVAAIISDKLPGVDKEQVKPESRFVKDLGASSIDVIELMMEIEVEFDLDEIPEEDAEGIVTVREVVDYIVAHMD